MVAKRKNTASKRLADAKLPVAKEQILDVGVIGSGVSSICLGVQLRQAGITNFALFEKSDQLGGTWHDNTYPGAACDVPSHLYSYSFEMRHDWPRRFSGQSEILTYINHCADKFLLRRHLFLNTEITSARFQEHQGLWKIMTATGKHYYARILVSGMGQLNMPNIPEIPGLEQYAGHSFHSARWDHDLDLKGKKVAVVGTGASAIQFVPEIAKQAAALTVFQRSANWIIPKPDRIYGRRELWLYEHFPWLQKLYRSLIYLQMEISHPILHQGNRLGKLAEKFGRWNIKRQVTDPVVAQKLTPDYPVGCRRILISNDYYPTFNQPHVQLVTDTITQVNEGSLQTNLGHQYEADVIIFGTGFKSTEFLTPLEIEGTAQQKLSTRWQQGAEAYLGMTIDQFPNFYMLYGPNTNLGHNSIIFMFECQVRYIVQSVQTLLKQNLHSIEVRPEVVGRYNEELQHSLTQTVWAANCHSWYKDESGKIINNWPNTTLDYWRRTRQPNWSEYRLQSQASQAETLSRPPSSIQAAS
jgi:cation diffusion facilitator CzcD-associated flavoprotein CzcO